MLLLVLEVEVARAMSHQQMKQLAGTRTVECCQLTRLQRTLNNPKHMTQHVKNKPEST
jgi:hypothetical protein